MATYSPPSTPQPSSPNSSCHSTSSRAEKIVEICKNCSYSFRIEFSCSVEFCSKDCETCFTFFRGSCFGSDKKRVQDNEKTITETKRAIYEFQNKLEDTDRRRAHEQELKRLEANNNLEAYEKLCKPKVQKSTKTAGKGNLFGWPAHRKPLHPQLQIFF